MNNIIYLDNAATTAQKPGAVLRAVEKAIINASGNPGRGSHIVASRAAELVYDARERAARMFSSEPERVVFTPGATYALNFAIKGLASDGGLILIDNYAHNAVSRPAFSLRRRGVCRLKIYDASGSDEETVENIKRQIEDERTVVVATHQSNISSKILPIKMIGDVCRRRGCAFVVDAAQSAGHMRINAHECGITALCIPAHKGLYGIMGAGMLISSGDARYRTVIEGGAGISSLDEGMPDVLPERLEAGTLPTPAIAALNAGMEFVSAIGEDTIHSAEERLARRLVKGLSNLDRIKLRGDHGGSVVSFTVDGISPDKVGAWLNERGICVRAGYHCAPLAHRTVGSYDTGSVRVGLSYFNTAAEIDATIAALSELCRVK